MNLQDYCVGTFFSIKLFATNIVSLNWVLCFASTNCVSIYNLSIMIKWNDVIDFFVSTMPHKFSIFNIINIFNFQM